MQKVILTSLVIVGIIGVIFFIESGKEAPTVSINGTEVETGIIETSHDTGKQIGDRAPEWRLQTFDGDVVTLSELHGTPVVIDFFAHWCTFCHEEFPFIEAAHQEYGEDVLFLGIHRTDTESTDKGSELAHAAGATFTLLQDVSGEVYGAHKSGPAMPLSFFIDRDGVIQDKVIGPKTPERLHTGIETIL